MNKLPQKEIFIKLLERCKYFEFTDEGSLDDLIIALEGAIEYEQALGFKRTPNGVPYSKKFFYCDNQVLHRKGGFGNVLSGLKIGLEQVCDFSEIVAVVPDSSTSNSQEASLVQFVTVINDFLKSKKIDYRLYPVYKGYGGALMILNDAQFLFLNKTIHDIYTKPQSLMEWKNEYLNPDEIIDNNNKYKYLNEGDKIQDEAFGLGFILEVNDKTATIIFRSGERTVLLKFANFQVFN